jgi:hypothetical protein
MSKGLLRTSAEKLQLQDPTVAALIKTKLIPLVSSTTAVMKSTISETWE